MGEEAEGWRPDGFLAEFDGETFDVEQRATSILKKENMGEEVARLTESLQRLDTVIQQHVCNNYTDLLSHAVASSELEQSLAVMSTHIQRHLSHNQTKIVINIHCKDQPMIDLLKISAL